MTALYTPERSDYVHALTVYTAPGKVTTPDSFHLKARIWVLEDRQVILCVPGHPRGVERLHLGTVSVLRRSAPKALTLEMEDGSSIQVVEANCACGMGAAGSAGPVDGRWKIERVRAPEWYITS